MEMISASEPSEPGSQSDPDQDRARADLAKLWEIDASDGNPDDAGWQNIDVDDALDAIEFVESLPDRDAFLQLMYQNYALRDTFHENPHEVKFNLETVLAHLSPKYYTPSDLSEIFRPGRNTLENVRAGYTETPGQPGQLELEFRLNDNHHFLHHEQKNGQQILLHEADYGYGEVAYQLPAEAGEQMLRLLLSAYQLASHRVAEMDPRELQAKMFDPYDLLLTKSTDGADLNDLIKPIIPSLEIQRDEIWDQLYGLRGDDSAAILQTMGHLRGKSDVSTTAILDSQFTARLITRTRIDDNIRASNLQLSYFDRTFGDEPDQNAVLQTSHLIESQPDFHRMSQLARQFKLGELARKFTPDEDPLAWAQICRDFRAFIEPKLRAIENQTFYN
jgi:hypothetical protein